MIFKNDNEALNENDRSEVDHEEMRNGFKDTNNNNNVNIKIYHIKSKNSKFVCEVLQT